MISQLAFAQIDMSSELLLQPSSAQAPDSAGLESGRYKTGKGTKSPASQSSADGMTVKLKKVKSLPGKKVSGSEVSLEKDLGQTKSVVVSPTTVSTTSTSTSTSTTVKAATKPETEVGKLLFTDAPAAKPATKSEAAKVVESAKPIETKSAETAPVVTAVPALVGNANAENSDSNEPSVMDQVENMVLGGRTDQVEAYKEQIHPDDIRMNRIEVTVAPGVVSNQSKSNYSYRNYNTFSPKVSLGANFWLTPFMGLYGNYTTSMGSDVVSDSGAGSRVSAQHEWTEIGFDIRKFFGMSRKSNSLQFGLHLSEYKFSVPGDDTHRVSLRSSGLGLHLFTRVPVAPSYAWVFGGKLIPRVQHSELATGVDLSSGQIGESTRVDLTVGGELKLARQNQITWDITSSFEKNQFNGQANLADPERGAAPKGVSVENSFFLFSLGYRWGQ